MKNVLFKQKTIPVKANFLLWKMVSVSIKPVRKTLMKFFPKLLILGEAEKRRFF